MGKLQKKRLEVSEGTSGIGTSFIDMSFDNDANVNVHGYIAQVAIEPRDVDANANGIVGVFVLPGGVIQNTDLPSTYGLWGDEDLSQYLWAFAPWTASNQTPFHWIFAPKSSRNMARGSRIVLDVRVNGITAGLAQINTTQSCFVTAV